MEKKFTHYQKISWIILPALLLVAALLRLHGIERESLWWDEYTSHVYLNASSLVEFLILNRTLDPLTLPLYYIFEYLWNHYVTESVYGLRLMSIAVGMATLPLLFAIGKKMFGTWAGYTAALLIAVSPVHIHHSQSIRMYVVLVFLAALVFWSFLRLLEKPSPGIWFLHGLASLLLYWTHPFAGLVPAVLGLFLLLSCFSVGSLFFKWTLLQVFLYAPTVAYLASVRFWPTHSTSEWIDAPSLKTLIADLFFDDISAYHWQFRISDFAQSLGTFRFVLDGALAVLIGMLLAYYLFVALRNSPLQPSFHRRNALLLFIWIFLPALMLYAVSWIIRPCMFPRYTVHCLLALYLALGGAVQYIPKTFPRITVIALLAGLLFLQWVWLQPGPQRTDWRSAGLYLQEHAETGDLVLVENFLWRDVFTHNVKHLAHGPLSVPVAAAGKAPLLAAQGALYLGMSPDFINTERPPSVWAVLAMDYFDPGPPQSFEQCLEHWGIPYQKISFPAIREIYVYRLEAPDPNLLPENMSALFSHWDHVNPYIKDTNVKIDHHAMQALGDLSTELARSGQASMAVSILNGLFNENSFSREIYGNLKHAIETGEDIESKAAAIRSLWDAYGFRDHNNPAYTRRALAKAVSLDPDHVIANFELGMEWSAVGDYAAAHPVLSKVVEKDKTYRDMLSSLLHALETGQDVPNKLEAVVAYRKGLMAVGTDSIAAEQYFETALSLDPAMSAAQLMLGYVLTKQNQAGAADEVLQQYLDRSESPDIDAFANMALIHAENNRSDQVMDMLQRLFAKSPGAKRVYGSLIDAMAASRSLPEAAAAIRAYWKGYDLRKEDRPEEARAAFQKAVELNPHAAFAQLELGLEWAASGHNENAAAALKAACTKDNTYQGMLRHLIAALETNRSIAEALEAVWSYRKGLVAVGDQHLDEAEQFFQQAVQLEPSFSDAQLMLGYVLTSRNASEKAQEALEQYLNTSAEPDVDAFAHMALIQAENGNPVQVESILSRLFEKAPQARRIYGPLLDAAASGGDLPQTAASIRALWKGFDARRKGNEEESRQSFSRAAELHPSNALARLEWGLEQVKTGAQGPALETLIHAGQLDGGYQSMLEPLLADLRAGAATDSSLNAVIAYRRGLLAQSEGDYEEAVAALTEAITLDPRLDDAHTSRAFNLIILKRFDQACEGIQNYLEQTQTPKPGAYGLLTVIHLGRREEEQARAAMRLARQDSDYWNQFGPLFSALLEERKYPKVIEAMDALKQQGIDLYPFMYELVTDFLADETAEPLSAACLPPPDHPWRKAMESFFEYDKTHPPLAGGILFTGSSTARLWNTQQWFPAHNTLNRGFGGSQFSDLSAWAEIILGAHAPDKIVVYSGDNDIHSGKSANQVAADCSAAVERLLALRPQSTLILLAIKPSASRWQLYPEMQAANALMEEYAQTRERVVFVDLGKLLLDAGGQPDQGCFESDKLHLSEEGYRRWSKVLESLF